MKPKVNIRNFTAGDEDGWFRLLTDAYGNLESRSLVDIQQLVRSTNFSSECFFLATVDEEIIGSIRVQPLPRKN
jgi:predicted N-acetyltransferase YhbS